MIDRSLSRHASYFYPWEAAGAYIFGYLPIGAVLVIGFGHADALGTAAAFFLPLTVLYGFLGMTAYYVCLAFPITQQERIWRALPAQAMAALRPAGFPSALRGHGRRCSSR